VLAKPATRRYLLERFIGARQDRSWTRFFSTFTSFEGLSAWELGRGVIAGCGYRRGNAYRLRDQ
jgi:hypothetical protein